MLTGTAILNLVGHEDVWRSHAACNGQPPDWWYPTDGTARQARGICAGCPVRGDCLQAALVRVEEHGIWGGTSERGRRKLRRLWLACPHPDRAHRVDGCGCALCAELDLHNRRMVELAATAAEAAGAWNTNGDNVTHGRASTYARGCHCDPCTDAMRASRQRNAKRRGEEAGAA